MSILKFDGKTHQLSLVNKDGSVLGSWAAYNNTDSHATIRYVKDGTYSILDKTEPRRHKADANGPYGLYGIIRFEVPGHPGIGVHSGRAKARHLPGPEHPTMGCIRTTDTAMLTIKTVMRGDSLLTIDVENNTAVSAYHASLKNQDRSIEGFAHA